tara:strand:+ start:1342 stop:1806 length:465 start_codon:yes stop_codon:yes gene_type:complete
MQVQIKANTLEVKNFLKSISRRQSSAIKKALNRVSNMAILMITKRTQSGRLPDGGTFIPYTKKTKELRQKKGRQTGHVDLTDTGKMFRSLDFRQRGFKNTLLFANKEREKIAFRHDVLGVGKRKTKRPFFSIGNKEEDKIKKEFSNFYFSQLKI